MKNYDADWFEEVLNAMHDMVLVKGPRSQLLWANAAFREYYGMTEADLRDIVDAEHSDPDDTLQYVIDDQTVFDTAADLNIESEIVTDAKGTARSFHTVKSPIFEDGQVVRSVGVSRLTDNLAIASRGIDHHDAKAFAAPLGAFTHCFPSPMALIDLKKRILKSNHLWDKAFGASERTPNSFLDGAFAHLPNLIELVEMCLLRRETSQADIAMDGPDGVSRHYSISVSPWSFADGVLGGATILATDVSEMRSRTEALQRANEELTQFSYRASHDLKGPLSTVKGLAKFIVEDITAGEAQEAKANASQIISTMERLEQTVISILELARADLQDCCAEQIDLEEVIRETCDGHAHMISDTGVRVRTDLQVRRFTSQRTRVAQIIDNLVSNAIKYRSTAVENPYVKISSGMAGDMIRIIVSDNGPGIPAGAEQRIFDLFSRFNSEQSGSGLGLAIVQKHVSALAGGINVKSTSEGTEFEVTLPSPDALRMVS